MTVNIQICKSCGMPLLTSSEFPSINWSLWILTVLKLGILGWLVTSLDSKCEPRHISKWYQVISYFSHHGSYYSLKLGVVYWAFPTVNSKYKLWTVEVNDPSQMLWVHIFAQTKNSIYHPILLQAPSKDKTWKSIPKNKKILHGTSWNHIWKYMLNTHKKKKLGSRLWRNPMARQSPHWNFSDT